MIHTLQLSGTFVTMDEPALTHGHRSKTHVLFRLSFLYITWQLERWKTGKMVVVCQNQDSTLLSKPHPSRISLFTQNSPSCFNTFYVSLVISSFIRQVIKCGDTKAYKIWHSPTLGWTCVSLFKMYTLGLGSSSVVEHLFSIPSTSKNVHTTFVKVCVLYEKDF
jgi:hypothetical protein